MKRNMPIRLHPMTVKIGSRVTWKRSGAPFGGVMTGYVIAIYDFHGFPKLKVRSNGHVYTLLPHECELTG